MERPFERMIEAGQLITYRHDGFWAPMDTLKDMQELEALYERGDPPWTLWRSSRGWPDVQRGPMRGLSPWSDGRPLELLLIGAHPDDIEIGCGGTVLRWAREGRMPATWLVLSGDDIRAQEARGSADQIPRRGRGTACSDGTVPGRLLPVRGGRTQGPVRGDRQDGRARHHPDPRSGRPPSGSPARWRAHLADVSRPPCP